MSSPNRSVLVLVAAILAATALAGIARADYLTGDPRKCSSNRPLACAHASAKVTLLKYMRTHVNPVWSNPMTCTQTSTASLLKWRCSFGTGTAVVWFRPLSTGWKRQVTVTMNS